MKRNTILFTLIAGMTALPLLGMEKRRSESKESAPKRPAFTTHVPYDLGTNDFMDIHSIHEIRDKHDELNKKYQFPCSKPPMVLPNVARAAASASTHSLGYNTPNENGLCYIHYAAMYNEPSVVNFLLNEGVDINTLASNDKVIQATALHYASNEGHLDMVKLLLARGASPIIPAMPRVVTSKEKFTALELAENRKRSDIAAVIKEYLNKDTQ